MYEGMRAAHKNAALCVDNVVTQTYWTHVLREKFDPHKRGISLQNGNNNKKNYENFIRSTYLRMKICINTFM